MTDEELTTDQKARIENWFLAYKYSHCTLFDYLEAAEKIRAEKH